MCQILGMNAARPTDFCFSFKGFAERGGRTDKHSDGWGLAFYEGKGLRTFTDPTPSCDSRIATLLTNMPIRTHNMISHIRMATTGAVLLENVHPFQRELWGIQWCFCHNGDLPHFADQHPSLGKRGQGGEAEGEGREGLSPSTTRRKECATRRFNPVGTTDSEAVFCEILNAVEHKFCVADGFPSVVELHDYMKQLCCEIIEGGRRHARQYDSEEPIFNFLMCVGGGCQFAFSFPGARKGSSVWNGLHYVVRKPPFRNARLVDCDYDVNFAELTNDEDQVVVIATKPLTKDETWIEFEKNELILFEAGVPYSNKAECHTCPKAAAVAMERTPELKPISMLASKGTKGDDSRNLLLNSPNNKRRARADMAELAI